MVEDNGFVAGIESEERLIFDLTEEEKVLVAENYGITVEHLDAEITNGNFALFEDVDVYKNWMFSDYTREALLEMVMKNETSDSAVDQRVFTLPTGEIVFNYQ